MSTLFLVWGTILNCKIRTVVWLLTWGLTGVSVLGLLGFSSLAGSEISLFLMGLTIYLLGLMVLTASSSKLLIGAFATMGAILQLLFSVTGLIAFYICFEASLIPMAIVILAWGAQPERLMASVYMLFYTIASALPFMGAALSSLNGGLVATQAWEGSTMVSLVLMLPFLVKTPLFLVHLWLPKAHVEAPVYGSMVLAGVLLKIGGYGLWVLHKWFSTPCIWLVGLISMVGGAVSSLITMVQTDIKSLIAYSSIVHMSLVTLSILIFMKTGNSGALAMMLGHGA